MDARMTSEIRLERYDEPRVDGIYDRLVTLYAETHQDLAGNMFYTTDRFEDFLVKQRAHPGFDLVAAWCGDRLVGVAFGFSRPTEQQFVFCELMVTPDFRGRGIAHGLHDELLRQRPERQAVLLVRKDNTNARAAYQRWGWTKIGDLQPTPEAPNFDELALPLSAHTSPNGF
jgi:ribosomal protein S18 acetylase RimI-like enzyme